MTTAMPHPQSPRLPSPDRVVGLGSAQPVKESLRSPGPLHASEPLSAPSPLPHSGLHHSPSEMAHAYTDPLAHRSQHQPLPQTYMSLDDGSYLHWPAQVEDAMSGLPTHLTSNAYAQQQYATESAMLLGLHPDGMPYTNSHNLVYPSVLTDRSCPRTYSNRRDMINSMGDMNMPTSYPPSAYIIEPPKTYDAMDFTEHMNPSHLGQFRNDFENNPSMELLAEETNYSTPYSSAPASRSSTPLDEQYYAGIHDPRSALYDDNPVDKELPYAQLIYRALMETPGHTMILRDIYDWFRKHTDKAADKEAKGWQNSIRHNLSMNGAFEKVDQQPCEDSKKGGFQWRLTDVAIREGVKSTTRYRSKQPNKRGHRSQNPQPQRQASGAKGGQAARRTAKLRRSHRAATETAYMPRNEQSMCRSVPYDYDPSTYAQYPDVNMQYPPSPFYGSDLSLQQSPIQDDFASPLMSSDPSIDTYSMSSYSNEALCGDAGYAMAQNTNQSLFYGQENSPSPSASEPLTPEMAGDSYMDMCQPPDMGLQWDDISSTYRE